MREEIVKLLSDLIKIKSLDRNPQGLQEVVRYCKNFLEGLPLKIHEYEKSGKPSLVITFGETKRPKVFFVGHLDVVDAEEDQFKPKIEGDRLYGRGALDMKGPDAIMLFLFRKLAEEGLKPDIGLMLTTDEEVGSDNGVRYLLFDEGWSSDFALIPDGGENFKLIIAEKGVLHVKLTARGKAAHGSRVWEGVNALDALINFYNDFKKEFPQEPCGDPEHWHNTINLGRFEGGNSVNRVADKGEMYLDIRFVEPWTSDKMLDHLREKASTYGIEEVELISRGEVMNTSPDEPHLVKFRKVASEVLGRGVELSKEHGATDGRFFAEKGIPVAITYPIGANIHGRDEWVDLNSLETLYRIMYAFVREI